MNSASLCSLAGRYDNPIPTWFLAPIDCLKFQLCIFFTIEIVWQVYFSLDVVFSLSIFEIYIVECKWLRQN